LLGWSPLADRASLTLLEFDGGLNFVFPIETKVMPFEHPDEYGPDAPVAYLGDDAMTNLLPNSSGPGLDCAGAASASEYCSPSGGSNPGGIAGVFVRLAGGMPYR